MADNESIDISSVVSIKSLLPYVQLRWGDQSCQMTPEEARLHAFAILEASNAAEMDAILVRFMVEKVGMENKHMAQILQDFRTYREKNRGIKEGHHRING